MMIVSRMGKLKKKKIEVYTLKKEKFRLFSFIYLFSI